MLPKGVSMVESEYVLWTTACHPELKFDSFFDGDGQTNLGGRRFRFDMICRSTKTAYCFDGCSLGVGIVISIDRPIDSA